jgi:hypothetical protein
MPDRSPMRFHAAAEPGAVIDADHRAARVALELEERARVGTEVDDGHAHGLDILQDVVNVRGDVLA